MNENIQSKISNRTIGYYQANAESFWQNTKDHDVTQNYSALLENLPQNKSLNILDFGCGPGRDVLYFKNLNHHVTGLDGSSNFCKMANKLTGCKILNQDFLELSLDTKFFDGIFANAAIFHIPGSELQRVLIELGHSLKKEGILFSSNPRGQGEGWNGDRFGFYTEFEEYQGYLNNAGFEVIEHYYRPKGLPRNQQPWLAIVARKV